MAVNNLLVSDCLKSSQEELKRLTRAKYDDFGSPGCDYTANTCGFVANTNVNDICPGLTRAISFQAPVGSVEYKQATITVSWTENGQPKTRSSTVLISHPPDPLPGNIKGKVTNSLTGVIISGVKVEVQHITFGKTANVLSDNNPNINYDFKDGFLSVGDWQLKASATGYELYTHSSNITVTTQQDTLVNFAMVPKPTSATINFITKDANTNNSIVFEFDSQNRPKLGMYQKGVLQGALQVPNGTSTYTFTVPFNGTYGGPPQECVTFSTQDLWRGGFVGNIGNQNGFANCSTKYHPDGISTSVIATNDCSTPWNGGLGLDTVCVTPGQVLNYNANFFRPIPLATLTGNVNVGGGIVGATFTAQSSFFDYSYFGAVQTFSIASPTYSMPIPAVQDFLPNNPSFYDDGYYWFTMSYTFCCNSTQTSPAGNNFGSVGPAYEGGTLNRDINMSGGAATCGDVDFSVIDMLTQQPLSGVTSYQSAPAVSDGGGLVRHQCSTAPPYAVDGWSWIMLQKSGYYQYSKPVGTSVNYFYSGTSPLGNPYPGSLPVAIFNGQSTYFPPDGPFGLWPEGFANITVTVRERISQLPLSNVTVHILGPHAGSYTAPPNSTWQQYAGNTDNLGQVHFNGVAETWPPPAAAGNLAINNEIRNYTVWIDVSPAIQSNYVTPVPEVTNITAASGQNVDVFVELDTLSGI